jgi:hypothetical protein
MQFAGKYAGRGSAEGQKNRTTAMDKVKAKKEGMTMKERAEEARRKQAEKIAERRAEKKAERQTAEDARKTAAQARNQAAIAKNKAKQAKLSGRTPKA